ncbi:hypothetical protein VP01_419g1 [Puccinia sorghi]|uniref:Uncharacterized protein n=1 Tax=Puccinia sorghi TaxID=27349 RepID=A0A0L6UQR8_9BASI|nr:hypothetical protein VP01_419g1 [Puccinia sorghi]
MKFSASKMISSPFLENNLRAHDIRIKLYSRYHCATSPNNAICIASIQHHVEPQACTNNTRRPPGPNTHGLILRPCRFLCGGMYPLLAVSYQLLAMTTRTNTSSAVAVSTKRQQSSMVAKWRICVGSLYMVHRAKVNKGKYLQGFWYAEQIILFLLLVELSSFFRRKRECGGGKAWVKKGGFGFGGSSGHCMRIGQTRVVLEGTAGKTGPADSQGVWRFHSGGPEEDLGVWGVGTPWVRETREELQGGGGGVVGVKRKEKCCVLEKEGVKSQASEYSRQNIHSLFTGCSVKRAVKGSALKPKSNQYKSEENSHDSSESGLPTGTLQPHELVTTPLTYSKPITSHITRHMVLQASLVTCPRPAWHYAKGAWPSLAFLRLTRLEELKVTDSWSCDTTRTKYTSSFGRGIPHCKPISTGMAQTKLLTNQKTTTTHSRSFGIPQDVSLVFFFDS